MLEFVRDSIGLLVPLFVVSAMLTAGLSQEPARMLAYLKLWRFVARMLVANFLLVPMFVVGLLAFFRFDPAMETGLLLFALCAGAPFLVKLTAAAGHDLALGTAVMMLLTVLTILLVPFIVPQFVEGVSVRPWAIARPLLVRMVAPLALGMIAARFAPAPAAAARPWTAKVANASLYAVILATLIGYSSDILEIIRSGAILAALATVLAAFGLGYLAGCGRIHLEDVGGLGTAQRNTAAGLIIATQNFDDPDVLVMLIVANVQGLVVLLGLAHWLRRMGPRASLCDARVRTHGGQ